MLLKKPLFAGNSTIDQIQTILKTIETPREEGVILNNVIIYLNLFVNSLLNIFMAMNRY